MKQQYVLANFDRETNRLVYYMGTCSNGSRNFGDILHAKRFNSLDEVTEEFKKDPGAFYLGVSIIGIANVTFDKLEESLRGDRDLYRKFHNPMYTIR